MNSRDRRILDDLSSHLKDKIVNNISDYIVLCKSAELNYAASMAELMTLLISLTSSLAADQFHISPREFADVMGKHFDRAQRKAEDDR